MKYIVKCRGIDNGPDRTFCLAMVSRDGMLGLVPWEEPEDIVEFATRSQAESVANHYKLQGSYVVEVSE